MVDSSTSVSISTSTSTSVSITVATSYGISKVENKDRINNNYLYKDVFVDGKKWLSYLYPIEILSGQFNGKTIYEIYLKRMLITPE